MSKPPRLSEATLASLPKQVLQPQYDRASVTTGIVHLGLGAFHRAHQAVYIERLLAADPRWGIVGASMLSPRVRSQLAPQDNLYSVVERDGGHQVQRVIGALRGVMVAPEAPEQLLSAMADPAVRIVSLTVTEKGYKLDADGSLRTDDPDVAADIARLDKPRTVPGFLTAALAERRARGSAPFTVLSCDNLPENGGRVRSAVLTLAAACDPGLADWIHANGAFPNTMVDRIVPATTEEDIAAFAAAVGVEDRGMVKTESFTQWVIEDRFADDRPAFESVGVQMTADVRPWEMVKLRLLNGAHSAIAYLGALAGAEHVHEAFALPDLRRFVGLMWDESAATLVLPDLLDVAEYRSSLAHRFDNAALAHRTRQIAMDGSQKIPQRLLAPISHRLEQGRSVDALALAVAAWMRWQRGIDEHGNAYAVEDPLAHLTREAWTSGTAEGAVNALLRVRQIFPPQLAAHTEFRALLVSQVTALLRNGAAATLANFAQAAR